MSTRFKPKFNIKKGDTVVVIAGDGKDLKKPRIVLEVIVDKGRVIVEGINIVKKQTKPNKQYTQGGIIPITKPIDVSKVGIIDPTTKKASRIGYTIDKAGAKTRVFKQSGKEIK